MHPASLQRPFLLACDQTSPVGSLPKRPWRAQVWGAPAYSPDLNPIKKMWSTIKAYLRKVKERDPKLLCRAIVQSMTNVSLNDILNWFDSCGYGLIKNAQGAQSVWETAPIITAVVRRSRPPSNGNLNPWRTSVSTSLCMCTSENCMCRLGCVQIHQQTVLAQTIFQALCG